MKMEKLRGSVNGHTNKSSEHAGVKNRRGEESDPNTVDKFD
jgi:hypothetical protein